jgi:peptide/nickel transport system substrate-binding protein
LRYTGKSYRILPDLERLNIVTRRLVSCWLILFVWLLSGCSNAADQGNSDSANQIVYGLTLGQLTGIDPHINGSSELGIPLRQVYDTLLYRDPATTDFTAGLATEWTISPDGLIYTFKLRQGVSFHDGTPFNAQAVGVNLDRITNPENASQKAIFTLGTYQSYVVVDDYTIQLILTEPYSPLLDSLSQVYLGIASPKALSEYSTNRYQFHQVGTGPYKFTEYVPGDRIVLQRNHEYWGGPTFYQPPANNSIEQLTFRFFSDPPTRAAAITSGEAQIMGEIQPLDARSLTGNSAIQLMPISVPGQPLQFMMNTQRFPTDNPAVRQAILYATNRNGIIDAVYQRFSPIAWGPLSASTLYYSRELNGAYAHNTAQAQTLLTNAGYSDSNNDGILDFGGVDLEVTVIVPPWGLIPEVAQLLQDQWRTVGIRAILEPVPTFNALIEKVNTGQYNLVAYYTFGFDPSFLNTFFITGASNNWMGYSNAELDNILTQAVRQTDTNVRRDLYAQAQHIIMNDALILPIRDYVNLNAASSGIQNLAFDVYGWFPLLTNATFVPPV